MKSTTGALLMFLAMPALAASPDTVETVTAQVKAQAKQCHKDAVNRAESEGDDSDLPPEKVEARREAWESACDQREAKRLSALGRLREKSHDCVLAAIRAGIDAEAAGADDAAGTEDKKIAACDAPLAGKAVKGAQK